MRSTRRLPAPPLPRSGNAAVHRARAPLNSDVQCAISHKQFLSGTAAALRLVQQAVKCLLPMAAMHVARASVPELPRRCENGRQSTGAVAAPAVRARPVGHDAADHLRRLCVAAGRPAASDDETDAHCASVARPVWAARPQFSCSARIACPRGRKSGPVRTQHTLGACSHSAEEQQDRGQAWAVPQVRRSPNKSESGGVVAKMSMYDVKLTNPRSLGTLVRAAHEGACRRALKRSHSAGGNGNGDETRGRVADGHRGVHATMTSALDEM